MRRGGIACLGVLLGLAGCASPVPADELATPRVAAPPAMPRMVLTAPARSPTSAQEPLPVERDRLFAKCSACHSLRPGINGIGPSLAGVFGRDIAAQPGFRYSDQLVAREGVWDPATLDRWLANPRAMVPGTKMLFAGLTSPLERAQLIAFLQRQPAGS